MAGDPELGKDYRFSRSWVPATLYLGYLRAPIAGCAVTGIVAVLRRHGTLPDPSAAK
jgi:hypothetical protein